MRDRFCRWHCMNATMSAVTSVDCVSRANRESNDAYGHMMTDDWWVVCETQRPLCRTAYCGSAGLSRLSGSTTTWHPEAIGSPIAGRGALQKATKSLGTKRLPQGRGRAWCITEKMPCLCDMRLYPHSSLLLSGAQATRARVECVNRVRFE